ncbi:MAG: radical SAM protein [Coriobacteriales bacterium]|jgi:uncharacterized protein|nr:radical SAM protein [Coriobacteriales bacterium]
MKASYYNVVTENPLGEGYLLFNTLYTSMCELTKDEKRIYDRIASGDGDHYPLAKDLFETKFVLEDPEVEARYLEYQYDLYKYNTEVMELVIAATMDCNNACVYCYETPRPGYMKAEVQDAVLEFVKERYEETRFKKLKVSWHGGEPLLRMEVIERLSSLLIGFCDEHDIKYIAHVTSNGRQSTPEVAKRLKELRVHSVTTSLDGCAQRHNCRRLSRTSEDTYDQIVANFDNLLDEGITVSASFPLECNNFKDYHTVGNELIKKPGMMVRSSQLRNYNDTFTEDAFRRIDLTTRPDFADQSFQFFMEQNPTAIELEEALAPMRIFCGTPIQNWWAIDELGNVYKCSGEMGDKERVIFSLLDQPEDRDVNWELLSMYMTFSPTKDEQCRKCRVLPLCQGECAFEHILFGRFCRTLLYTIEDYVKAYYVAIERETDRM